MTTIGYVTSRPEPRFDWFFSSLRAQLRPSDELELVIVDFYAQPCDSWTSEDVRIRENKVFADAYASGLDNQTTWVRPKPTVWAGPHRITNQNWWAAANARNTALCLARGDFWAMVDDRCVLMPTWMEAVRQARQEHYAVCGPYQKRTGITVENGAIKHAGIVTGEDNRLQYVREHYDIHEHLKNPYSAPGEWLYGCSFGLPTEWALKVNGMDETCDSSSGEDYIFGLMLQNNGYPLYYDTRMMIVEDRTPEFLGPPMIRRDKGQSPNDKSHALLTKLKGQRRAQHPWDLNLLRTSVLSGGQWPHATWPTTDWYDGQQVKDMTP